MDDYSPPMRIVDVHGEYWRYTGFKPAQDLTHNDIGKRIGFKPDTISFGTFVLESFEIHSTKVFTQQIQPKKTLPTPLLLGETIYLWVKENEDQTKKEFRFIGIDSDIIVQIELARLASDFIRKIYDSTPTLKVEYREVEEWKEYDLG